jgi:hypothetical protein
MTGYQTFTHTFAVGGVYTVGVGVVDVADTAFDSGLLVDNFQVEAVPAPAGALLFGLGMVSLGGARWARRRPTAA